MSKSKPNHVRTVALIFILIVAMGAIAYWFINYAQKSLCEESSIYLSEISNKSADLIRTKVDGELELINALASFIGNLPTYDYNQALAILYEEASRNNFKRMGIVSPEGMATTTEGYTFDFSHRRYFQLAMQGQTNVSDRLTDKVDGKAIHVAAAPIVHEGKIVAAIFATQSSEEYSKVIAVNTFGGEGFSYIIDKNGTLILHIDHDNCKGDYENFFDEVVKPGVSQEEYDRVKTNMQRGRNGTLRYVQDEVSLLLNYTRIGVNDWYMMSVVPELVVARNSNRLIQLLATIATIIILSIATIAYLMIDSMKQNKASVEKIAFTDRVTGYGNWNYFSVQSKALLHSHCNELYAIVIFDIDQFKIVNDMFGHETGNKILCGIADTLYADVDKQHELFARTSSDNFNMLIRFESIEQTTDRVFRLINAFNENNLQYSLTFSFGIYVITDKTLDVSTLSDRANLAKRTVKGSSTEFLAFYSDSVRDALLREKELENMMEDALANNEFQLYLQPKFWFSTQKLAGAEALVRWQSAQKGFLYPDSFIPLFEKNGFIKLLDKYMFEHTCALIRHWQDNNMLIHPISVNLSRLHLDNKLLRQELVEITEKYGISPTRIEIELTESAVFNDKLELIKIMSQLKDAGFLISIDDFGSGYSSLNTLKDLPANTLKLDKEFLTEASDSLRGKKIIASILRMTQDLKLVSVAEGVETKEQADFLREAGCDIAQGYYYAKPMPIADFEKLLEA